MVFKIKNQESLFSVDELLGFDGLLSVAGDNKGDLSTELISLSRKNIYFFKKNLLYRKMRF